MTTPMLTAVLDCVADAAVDGMTAAGVDPPAGPWTSHTKPVIDFTGDCDRRLAVYYDPIVARGFGTGRPSSPGDLQQAGVHTVLAVRIQWWDCITNIHDNGSPATLTEQANDANRVAAAAWGIWVELATRRKAETLFAPLGEGMVGVVDVGLDRMMPLPPAGYMAGWQINLEVSVPFLLVVTEPGS